MQNTLTIARRQTLGYFNGPVAYIVACLLLFLLGLFFWSRFFLFGRATMGLMFQVLSLMMYFATPAITMGLIAEERRSGTLELLITLPVRDWEVILGKYLAALSLLVTILLLTLPYPFSVSSLGNLDWGTVWTGYLGIFLQGAALLAIGLMVSSWTGNQLIAFFIAMGVGIFFFIIDWFLPQMPTSLVDIASFISFGDHVSSMGRGVIDTKDVFYFLSITVFSLALAFVSLSSRRWR
jgi:ABC-2 type transport system permease protein